LGAVKETKVTLHPLQGLGADNETKVIIHSHNLFRFYRKVLGANKEMEVTVAPFGVGGGLNKKCRRAFSL